MMVGPNATGRIVARYAMRDHARQLRRACFRRTARTGLLIESFPFPESPMPRSDQLTDSTPVCHGAETWLVQLRPAPLESTPCYGDAITRHSEATCTRSPSNAIAVFASDFSRRSSASRMTGRWGTPTPQPVSRFATAGKHLACQIATRCRSNTPRQMLLSLDNGRARSRPSPH